MTRSERMDAVRGLEDRKVEVLARELAESRRQLENRRHRLRQLREYMEEYSAAQGAGERGELPAMFQERRAFLQRLNEAVRQAESQVSASEENCEQALARWRAQRGRAQALSSVSEKLRAEAEKETGRREQRLTDEIGARTGRHRDR